MQTDNLVLPVYATNLLCRKFCFKQTYPIKDVERSYMTKAQRLVMEKEAEAQRKIQDKDARLDRLKEIMASHQRPGQQPRTPQVSRGRHAAAATPATTRAERAVSFSCSLRVFSFCRKRRFMPLLQNRPNRLNQIISRF